MMVMSVVVGVKCSVCWMCMGRVMWLFMIRNSECVMIVIMVILVIIS